MTDIWETKDINPMLIGAEGEPLTARNISMNYMMKTKSGGMRQPVFKGLREDKAPEDCVTNKRVEK